MFGLPKKSRQEITEVRFRQFAGVCLLALPASVAACKSKSASSISPSKTKEAATMATPATDTRKAIVQQHRDFLRSQIASLDQEISSSSPMASQASPGLSQAFNVLAGTDRQFRDAYARELKQVEEALDNWESWGKNTVFPWELSQPDHSHSLYSNFSNPSSGASSRQCRTCGVCNGNGSIGPFGNAYSGAGYRPAQTCSNCGGSGTVCY